MLAAVGVVTFERIADENMISLAYDGDFVGLERWHRLGGNVDAQVDGAVDTPLSAASKNGSIDCVRWLLSKGADPDLRNAEGRLADEVTEDAAIIELIELARRPRRRLRVRPPDADGLLTDVHFPADSTQDIALDYDALGRLIQVSDKTGTATSEYDDLGNVIEAVRTYAGRQMVCAHP